MGPRDFFRVFLKERPVMVITAGDSSLSHLELASKALKGGCGAVQLRDKQMGNREFRETAGAIKDECVAHDALFLVNDRVDVAVVAGAHGVHLGVEDLSPLEADDIIGHEMILGFSPEPDDVCSDRIPDRVDYLGVGPVFATYSKADAGVPLGIGGIERAVEWSELPVVAVGGVTADNAREIMECGVAGIAVLSAIREASDMEAATSELVDIARMYARS